MLEKEKCDLFAICYFLWYNYLASVSPLYFIKILGCVVEREIFMKKLWEYISGETKIALTMKQVVTYLTLVMACIHILLFILFMCFDVHMMAAVNVVSIVVYINCFIWLHFGKSSYVVFNLCYAEVIIHAMLATFAVGSSCGFLLYMVCMIPIAYYAAYSFRSSSHFINPVVYIFTTIIAFVISKYASWAFEPMYDIGNSFVQTSIYIVNYLLVVVAIVVFMSTFLIQIKTLEEIMIKKNERLEILSTHDVLTGLANRRSINQCYKNISRQQQDYAIILGDIDDFKHINDTYGHTCGDNVLKSVANVFKTSVRDCDIVCRWGGEEILVMLPDCGKDTAVQIAEDIIEEIRKLVIISQEGDEIKVTMTLGTASSDEGKDIKDIIKEADNRLYYGKGHGKNCVVDYKK